MKWFSYLLLPLSPLYGLITFIRNRLYDFNILKSTKFELPVIGIGNLTTGGTGKTPMAEYVLSLLIQRGYKPALLSRGYGRSSKGFQIINTSSDANAGGDEPVQIKNKFPQATVAVCENRVEGIKKLITTAPGINVIVLDDCFQHRALKAGFYILLTDYNQPYFKDFILPAGRLRESISGRKRADMIVMTKTPPLTAQEKVNLKSKLQPQKNQAVYFTGINYEKLKGIHLPNFNVIDPDNLSDFSVLLFAGIANPKPLGSFIGSRAHTLSTLFFPDHHYFKKHDMDKIRSKWKDLAGEKKILITTEKDWHRLRSSPLLNELSSLPLYVLPIHNEWNNVEKANFDEKILSYVGSNQKIG